MPGSLPRVCRQLLFLDNAALGQGEQTAGLPPLVVLHHIVVRSPLALPHALHGWAEAEYVRWIDEHAPGEAWSLVESAVLHWEKVHGGEADTEAQDYIALVRTLLADARTP